MAERNGPIVRMPLRVRYHECDQQGIVFHAHYLAYADMASFEVFKALFGSHAVLLERGVDVVVAESTVRYLAPCRFDDDLSVEPHVERLGTTSLALRYEIRRDGTLAAEVTNRYVWVDPEALRPTAPPGDVRDAFREFT
ncbi:YbgC/FadM family acyl-CoA thioesterase [Allosaccharopolyspora coralli]|uniref:YbgC/FadM family acyl-CoA thioesterase n=1 Tax=Allosaccharopolyspora coralli TaxID=2665642 RepID=A0A5Q3QC12_9PSEU|nr:thioesterase family protein [Allosaccharopolyspora coralli]QGK69139.1 YbgC/FadM family acyl-CoA thioesterase [Allosaccharopolyspora coralli]